MADFSTLIKAQARDLHIRGSIAFANGSQIAITGAEIMQLTIDEGADDVLTPGCVLSAGFTLDLANDAGQWMPGGEMLGLNSLPGAQLALELGVADGEDAIWSGLGVFTIESALQLESEARMRLHGADGISHALSAAFEDALTYPATLQQLWQHALAQTAYSHSGNIPNGDAVIDLAPEWNGASLRTVLGWIAAAAGCFVRLDRGGNLALCRIWDAAEPYGVHPGNYMRLEWNAVQFGPVDGLKVVPEGAQDVQPRSYFADGAQSALYSFTVSGNPLFRGDAEHMDALAQGLLAEIAGYKTLQAGFDFRGDPMLEVGRRIAIQDLSGGTIEGILSRQSLHFSYGLLASCTMALPTDSADGIRRALTADGGVNAAALVGTVDGALLKVGSVTAEKIAAGVISAQAVEAVTAYIGELVAGNITADQLYADLATIAQAQITAANIENADIDWASINNLTANIASVANAQIGTANIGYGQITDLVTNTAIITEGAAGQLYIARLNVTEANMAQLTVGSLMLQAEDGSFVQLVADGSGGVSTLPVQVEGDNIAEGTVSGSNLIQNTITARELNVEKIFADEALIRAIKAANIDVADLFAAEATIEQLESWVVSANTIQALENALDIWASEKITLAIRSSEAAGVVNSSVTITENAVDIATPTFHVHNSETGMTFDENGLTAESVEAPNVAKRYDGPSTVYVDPEATSDQIATGYYYRSLADVIALLSNRWIGRNVTVNLAAGMVEYGSLELRGTTGSGQISIVGSASNPAKLVGSMRVYACSNTVEFSCLNVDAADDVPAYRISGASTYVHVQNAVVNGGSRGVQAEYGAAAYIQNCEFYDGTYSVCAWMMGQACSENNKGNANLYATRARIYANGTQPCAETSFTYSAFAGDVIAQSVTVDQGSSSSAEAQPATASYAAANTDSYGDGWSRFDDNDVRQGYTENAGEIRGCMWFDNDAIRAALSGKTVRQASLSLHQLKGYGRGVGVNVYLKGTAMDYAGRSGSPAIAADYGLIGATEPGETTEITIPVQAVNDLVAGTINGLMLIADDGEAYKDRTYSKNYARFSGETTGSNLPVIKITYT